MVKKEFDASAGYLHIPVRSGDPELSYYIDVEADGQWKNEFLIQICPPGQRCDFYVALDMARYGCRRVTLSCKDEDIPADLFEAIIPGGTILERRDLYPILYWERNRQQVHFSPARGWMNDPNGLFYKDSVLHMYFQHNPFAAHHFGTNVSWGHAISSDGVHFREVGDAIMPRNSQVSIASGSALVDLYNISGQGQFTVLAAYTDLVSTQYHGRPEVTTGGGQNLLYSTDNGMTFHYFPNNPIIPVPDGESWRDPKLIQLDQQTLCIAVYETYQGQNCVSFYKSTDCKEWTFCSRSMDLYECPDLFKVTVSETGEELWVLYGASGKYQVGSFEDFQFIPNGSEGYLDYGECIYAGQTFNNFRDPYARLHMAWMRDHEKPWDYAPDEPYQADGFSQSMSLLCRLELHKTPDGYRLYRNPVENLTLLRRFSSDVTLSKPTVLPVPGEVEFTLNCCRDARVYIGGVGFAYDAQTRTVTSSSGKRYRLSTLDDFSVRIVVDRRSAEMFIAGEISMSFSVVCDTHRLTVENGIPVDATIYQLKSIWQ